MTRKLHSIEIEGVVQFPIVLLTERLTSTQTVKGSKQKCNKKVLLRERKRLTDRGVSSTTRWDTPPPSEYPPSQVWRVGGYQRWGTPHWGTPSQVWWGTWGGVTPPSGVQWGHPPSGYPLASFDGAPEVGYPMLGSDRGYQRWGTPWSGYPPSGYPPPPSGYPP